MLFHGFPVLLDRSKGPKVLCTLWYHPRPQNYFARPRPWWQAPFLARWDMQSRLEAGPAGGEERMISAAEAKAMAGLVWQS